MNSQHSFCIFNWIKGLFGNSKGSREEEDKPVDNFIAFVTNIKFDGPERVVDIIPEEYRWGIETSYRVEDGFKTKTTSRNFKSYLLNALHNSLQLMDTN